MKMRALFKVWVAQLTPLEPVISKQLIVRKILVLCHRGRALSKFKQGRTQISYSYKDYKIFVKSGFHQDFQSNSKPLDLQKHQFIYTIYKF